MSEQTESAARPGSEGTPTPQSQEQGGTSSTSQPLTEDRLTEILEAQVEKLVQKHSNKETSRIKKDVERLDQRLNEVSVIEQYDKLIAEGLKPEQAKREIMRDAEIARLKGGHEQPDVAESDWIDSGMLTGEDALKVASSVLSKLPEETRAKVAAEIKKGVFKDASEVIPFAGQKLAEVLTKPSPDAASIGQNPGGGGGETNQIENITDPHTLGKMAFSQEKK